MNIICLFLGWRNLLRSISATYFSTHPVNLPAAARNADASDVDDGLVGVASCYTGQGYCGWLCEPIGSLPVWPHNKYFSTDTTF